MSAQTQYQAKQVVESLKYISMSLKTVQGDVELLSKSINTLYESNINLDSFQDDFLIEVQTAREAIAKTLVLITGLEGGSYE